MAQFLILVKFVYYKNYIIVNGLTHTPPNHSDCIPSILVLKGEGQSSATKCVTLCTIHAQEGMLSLVIVGEGFAFVGERRIDTYYRNDPSEYSLNWSHLCEEQRSQFH